MENRECIMDETMAVQKNEKLLLLCANMRTIIVAMKLEKAFIQKLIPKEITVMINES